MTLVTTVVAPPALVGLFAPKKRGVRHPKQSHDNSRPVVFELSTPDIAALMLDKLVAEFREEGFYTSLLSKEDSIWEIAMDDMELSVRRDGSTIEVSCTPPEEAIVMTAWMEVASEMNDLARQISKPLRREDVDRMLPTETAQSKSRHSGVGRHLQHFVMLPKFRASSKQEAIERLVAEIATACPTHVKDAAEATAAVLRREASMPTGLDHGIAVPHGRSPFVEGIVCRRRHPRQRRHGERLHSGLRDHRQLAAVDHRPHARQRRHADPVPAAHELHLEGSARLPADTSGC